MLQNTGFRFKVARPAGTRFENPLVHMVSPSSLRRGWARPIDTVDAEMLRRNAKVLVRLLPRLSSRS